MPDTSGARELTGTIAISCPWCGQLSQVPLRYGGRKGRCMSCKGQVFVPSGDVEARLPSSRLRFLLR